MDPAAYPDGLSGANGVQLPSDPRLDARAIAAVLGSGPLPLRLVRR